MTTFTQAPRFRAFDGEAIDQQYCLLATSDQYIYSKSRLSTKECLDFLFRSLGADEVGVFFGMHYDIVNILKDLPESQIESLNEFNTASYKGYEIVYFPRKIFSIKKNKTVRKFYDVWGFYQSSFESAISDQLGIKDEAIKKGKSSRSNFQRKHYREIIRYNALECKYLEQLCDKLAEVTSDFDLKSWHGASAISGSVLAKIPTVKINKLAETELDTDSFSLVREGYYGGRIEALKLGHIEDAVSYDIVSAYPSAMTTLPDLVDFKRHRKYIPNRQGYYHIKYSSILFGSNAPAPFPQHHKNRLLYPSSCETVITHHELEAFYYLASLYPDLYRPSDVKIMDAITVPQSISALCVTVQELFAKRKELKAQKDLRQMAYKLALNSMYGKFAQKVGNPKYSVYFWAGLITGHCRGQMLRLAGSAIHNVVMFATDSITFNKSVELEESKNLGGLELAHRGSVNVLMSGMYQWSDGNEAKVRGFKGLDFTTAYKAVNETGQYIHKGRMLVGFNPPKLLKPYRGHIIDYPKRLRLDSNIKRDYDSFDFDLYTEFTDSSPHINSDMAGTKYHADESEIDVLEI